MNIGRFWADKDDGLIHLIVRIGDDLPQVRRFNSLSTALLSFQSSPLPYEHLVDFCFAGLKPESKVTVLPGGTEDWKQYLAQ